MAKTVLLSREDNKAVIEHIRHQMRLDPEQPEALLISDNANLIYITGRVFDGYIFIPLTGPVLYFFRRPNDLESDFSVAIRKPEEIPASLGYDLPDTLGLELELLSWTAAERLKKVFPKARTVNATALMRRARAVKLPFEVELTRRSAVAHERVYSLIPSLYRPGMNDLQLQVEIERASRLEGCLGQFRISGSSMEFFMGNVLAGDNADTPSPYDFAMGGAGQHPSLPVGACGLPIRPGQTLMVDMNGNFSGYMTDMTRVFRLGDIAPEAQRAHDLSISIHRELAQMGRPGVEAKALCEHAHAMVHQAGLQDFFMGHRQKAGFIGHGVGIEINELPVIAPRSRDVLQEGNIIALEPKFVIPGTGAVGVENTYLVTDDGLQLLTHSPEEILPLG